VQMQNMMSFMKESFPAKSVWLQPAVQEPSIRNS
jgi:hypothetical protein